MMSARIFCFGVILMALSVAKGADSGKGFSGKWEAKFNDTVICTIELRTAGESVSGSMVDCRFDADADGNLREPGPSDSSPNPSPILNARVTQQVLYFEGKDDDDPEPIKFEMRLIKEGVADLDIKNAPVKIKPIRFLRASPSR